MAKLIIIIILCSSLSGCHQNNTKYKDLLVGEWELTSTSDSTYDKGIHTLFDKHTTGLIFDNDGIFTNRSGFLEYTDDLRRDKILGFKTNYYLTNEILYVFDKSTKNWKTAKIISVNESHLKLQYADHGISNYKRWGSNDRSKAILYDNVVVSFCGCAGDCPFMNLQLNRDGSFYYEGSTNLSVKNGYFHGTLDADTKNELSNLIARIDVKDLKDFYGAARLHQEEINLSFVSKNKVIKSSAIYGESAPNVISWLLKRIELMAQPVYKMTPVAPKYVKFDDYSFKSGSSELSLSRSESFYLWNLLQNSTYRQKHKGALIYKLVPYLKDNLIQIRTDGRVFEIIENKKKSALLDVGVNFIDVLANIKSFKKY